jgi:hypothetical protein
VTGRRLRHRARDACPMAPTLIACHAPGREGACALCDMIDMDHPTTVATLGLPVREGRAEAQERTFYEHLARRYDGRPPQSAREAQARSHLPIEAPF